MKLKSFRELSYIAKCSHICVVTFRYWLCAFLIVDMLFFVRPGRLSVWSLTDVPWLLVGSTVSDICSTGVRRCSKLPLSWIQISWHSGIRVIAAAAKPTANCVALALYNKEFVVAVWLLRMLTRSSHWNYANELIGPSTSRKWTC